ncbi:tyrosine-type recombinase/integrase [Volucribacter amazonae]|uniref:Integrase n=1 Tax=Volucribacter amazonae TaxID=256731 RepID=A0A9X4P9C4_9PAST|nr:tyrosine-type recombinase/integrase [Volucribacter amazonae]MDG6894142.1 integrase [Volucribacter amazonae]
MPRKSNALNNTQVERAKPADSPLNDGDGLYLYVEKKNHSPKMTKIWRFRYIKPFSQSRTWITIGTYPEITLKQAREIKSQYRALLIQGIDPNIQRQQEKLAKTRALRSTFRRVAEDWFKDRQTRANFSADYAKDVWRLVERYLLPAFGDMPISEITASMAIKAFKIQARGTLETLKRTIQKLNEIMTYAKHHDLIIDNRMAELSKAFDSPTVQHMKTIRPEDLGEFLMTLANAQIHIQTRLLIQWQLLTLTRPAEAATAKFEDIDESKKIWRVMVKKGIKGDNSGRVHLIPLSRQAVAVLREIKKINKGRTYLFPSIKDPSKHCNTQTANAAIKRMGYQGKLVAHGLRSIASTALNEQGFNKDYIEVALSHMDKDKVRAAYNHALYLEQRAKMLQWWGDFVEQASNQTLPKFHLKLVNG